MQTNIGTADAALADIHEVSPLSEADSPCLNEVRAVLERHGMRDRFGVTLLHAHFPLGEGETLMESVDRQTRTLTLRPMTDEEVVGTQTINTSWRFMKDGGLEALSKCRSSSPQAMIH